MRENHHPQRLRSAQSSAGRIAVVLDVDGVVSPIDGHSAWGDDVTAGRVLGSPVRVSPSMCRRLNELGTEPFVECVWLTSWTEPMRLSMDPFPGRDWPTAADPEDPATYTSAPTLRFAGDVWWKWEALNRWLQDRHDVAGLVWCDDHLRGPDETWLLRDAVAAELARRRLRNLLIAPKARVGLTPPQMARITSWLRRGARGLPDIKEGNA